MAIPKSIPEILFVLCTVSSERDFFVGREMILLTSNFRSEVHSLHLLVALPPLGRLILPVDCVATEKRYISHHVNKAL